MSTAAPQPIIIQVVKSSAPTTYEHYNAKGAKVLGGLQIALAILAILFNLVAICLETEAAYSFYGLSFGIFWIIAGSFGIASAYRKTACTIITTLVLSVLCATGIGTYVAYSIGQIVSVAANREDTEEPDWDKCGCFDTYDEETETTQTLCVDCAEVTRENPRFGAQMAMASLMLAVGIAELIVAIVASALCCRAACCCRKPAIQPQNTANQQLIVNTTSGQQTVALPIGYQVVPPAHGGDVEKKLLAGAPQYTACPPPPYSTGQQ